MVERQEVRPDALLTSRRGAGHEDSRRHAANHLKEDYLVTSGRDLGLSCRQMSAGAGATKNTAISRLRRSLSVGRVFARGRSLNQILLIEKISLESDNVLHI